MESHGRTYDGFFLCIVWSKQDVKLRVEFAWPESFHLFIFCKHLIFTFNTFVLVFTLGRDIVVA